MPLLTLALGGCVAVALPAIAGGALVRSANTGRVEVASQQVAPARSDVALAQVPAPQPVQGQLIAEPSTNPGFANFVEFAQNQASAARSDFEAPSAVLSNPGQLDGKRLHCNGQPPAVLIDLDPKGEIFGPDSGFGSYPDIATELKQLRASGISIGWISGANADQAGAVRRALSLSGLDSAAEDQLLLMRYPEDRKQTRRNEFAASNCIVAIAGDALADFDELYLFLKSPDAAQSLDALIGDGWFITPLVLTKQ